jgi:hypothetical protein
MKWTDEGFLHGGKEFKMPETRCLQCPLKLATNGSLPLHASGSNRISLDV